MWRENPDANWTEDEFVDLNRKQMSATMDRMDQHLSDDLVNEGMGALSTAGGMLGFPKATPSAMTRLGTIDYYFPRYGLKPKHMTPELRAKLNKITGTDPDSLVESVGKYTDKQRTKPLKKAGKDLRNQVVEDYVEEASDMVEKAYTKHERAKKKQRGLSRQAK
jgi:hypothetical protein